MTPFDTLLCLWYTRSPLCPYSALFVARAAFGGFSSVSCVAAFFRTVFFFAAVTFVARGGASLSAAAVVRFDVRLGFAGASSAAGSSFASALTVRFFAAGFFCAASSAAALRFFGAAFFVFVAAATAPGLSAAALSLETVYATSGS